VRVESRVIAAKVGMKCIIGLAINPFPETFGLLPHMEPSLGFETKDGSIAMSRDMSLTSRLPRLEMNHGWIMIILGN